MKTIYMTDLINTMIRGEPYSQMSNTTLNEKYSVLENQSLPEDVYPIVNYFGIGIGGSIDGAGMKRAIHQAKDGCLYDHIPLICRESTADLAIPERENYRLRVEQLVDDVLYVFYYLKVIPESVEVSSIKHVTKGITYTISDFVSNDSTILTPVPIINDSVYDESTLTFLVRESKLYINLTYDEMQEVISAYNILYNTVDTPLITEVMICIGVEYVNPDTSKEAIGVQAGYFYEMPYDKRNEISNNSAIQEYFNIGGMELLRVV